MADALLQRSRPRAISHFNHLRVLTLLHHLRIVLHSLRSSSAFQPWSLLLHSQRALPKLHKMVNPAQSLILAQRIVSLSLVDAASGGEDTGPQEQRSELSLEERARRL